MGIRTDSSGNFGALTLNGVDQMRFGADTSGQLAGFRNRIINGAFKVWQRGLIGTILNNAPAYICDRWRVTAYGGNVSWNGGNANAVDSGGLHESEALYLDGTTGLINCEIEQRIEAVNCRGLEGKNVTVSFWVGGNWVGTGAVHLQKTAAKDNWATPTTIQSFPVTFNGSGVYQLRTFTFNALPADVANGLKLIIGTGPIGAGKYVLFSNVQLEAGSVATPFEHRPIGLELALCQKYCRPIEVNACIGQAYSTVNATVMSFGVPMRAAPTLSSFAGLSLGNVNAALIAVTGASIVSNSGGTGSGCVALDLSVASGLVAGQATYVRAASQNFLVAEL